MEKRLTLLLETRFADLPERDKITECLYEQLSAYRNVYFEIGLIAGGQMGIRLGEKMWELKQND